MHAYTVNNTVRRCEWDKNFDVKLGQKQTTNERECKRTTAQIHIPLFRRLELMLKVTPLCRSQLASLP